MINPISNSKLPPIPPKSLPKNSISENVFEKVFGRFLRIPMECLWAVDKPNHFLKGSEFTHLISWLEKSPLEEKHERDDFVETVKRIREIGQSKLQIQGYSQISKLPSLQPLSLMSLEIHDCASIKSLPRDLKLQENLSKLSIRNCPNFNQIPDEIKNLQKIRLLELVSLGALESINSNICHLENLETLHVQKCPKVNKLPKDIYQLQKLQVLNLYQCTNLEELPFHIGALKKLYYVNLGDTKLTYLPDTIGNLDRLETLVLSRCGEIQTLPESLARCVSLTQILANDCKKLTKVPPKISTLGRKCTICFLNSPIAFSSMSALEKVNRFFRLHTDHLGPKISISESSHDFGLSPLDQLLLFFIKQFQASGLEEDLQELWIDFFRHETSETHQKTLSNFLRETIKTSEFKNPQARAAFLKTLLQVLIQASSSPDFYFNTFHPLAISALSSCEDQLLIGINRMFLESKIAQHIQEKNIQKTFDFLLGFRNLQLLYEEVKILEKESKVSDFVEAFLSLQIHLQETLKLPFQTRTMKYSHKHFAEASQFAKEIESRILGKTSSKESQLKWLCNEPEKVYSPNGRIQTIGGLSPENPFAQDLASLWAKALEDLDPDLHKDIELSEEDSINIHKLQEYSQNCKSQILEKTKSLLKC